MDIELSDDELNHPIVFLVHPNALFSDDEWMVRHCQILTWSFLLLHIQQLTFNERILIQ